MKTIARLLRVSMCYSMLVLTASVTSCAHPTPKEWWPSTHKDMMGECRIMCKEGVFSYEAVSGSCQCQGKGK